MAAHPILDCNALLVDLRLASGFAARAGLLRDTAILSRLKAVEESGDAGDRPDPHELTLALNDVAQAIAPMTLADLRSGRNPFERVNQIRARGLQLFLAIIALITMLMIGHSMSALRTEKVGLQALQQLSSLRPIQNAVALRKLAQLDDVRGNASPAADLYRQKLGELIAMFEARELTQVKIKNAMLTPKWPWELLNEPPWDQWPGRIAALFSPLPATKDGGSDASSEAPSGSSGGANEGSTTLDKSDAIGDAQKPFCERNAKGAFVAVQSGSYGWPKTEFLEDYCFRAEVLQPIIGIFPTVEQEIGRLGDVPDIESKVSLRTEWLLPFLFGCLGAIIFVMRNVANVHTPAMKLFPVLMRISLGGIAGVVIGWFSSAALPGFQSPGALSLPFALAFLIGYGIDALFSLLDRMSRLAAADPAQQKAA